MNTTFKVATIGGIDIAIDWTWLLAVAFFTWSLGAYYDSTFPSWGHTTAYLIGAVSTLLLFVLMPDAFHVAHKSEVKKGAETSGAKH